MVEVLDYKKIAKKLFNDIQKVEIKNTPNLRRVHKKYSKRLAQAAPNQILDFARYFIKNYNYRWIAFEIIHCHKTAINGYRHILRTDISAVMKYNVTDDGRIHWEKIASVRG